jgi:D-alanine-D-alanine ligase
LRIGVLAGGPSSERPVSLRSGRAVYRALKAEGFNVKFLDIPGEEYDTIKKSKIDVAFLALHGRFGEDGTIQAMLERLGIPYTGSGVRASRLALDKIASKRIFEKKGIPVPRYGILTKKGFRRAHGSRAGLLGWPLVVKPQFEGSSIGLSVVRDPRDLEDAMEKAFAYGDKVLLEEYIDGRELTVGILGEKALPVVEIVPPFGIYDTRAKYKDKRTRYLVPAPLHKQVFRRAQMLGLAAHRALGCSGMSRVDMRMDRGGDIFVLEVNSIPGMTERSLLPKAAKAQGLSFDRLCVRLLTFAVGRPM